MNRLTPLLLTGLLLALLAACAPGPQEPAPLEPVPPTTTVPDTTAPETTVPETTVPEVTIPDEAATDIAAPDTATPEEPTVTVIPAEPADEAAAESATEPDMEAAPPSGGAVSGGAVVTDPSDPGISATIGISADNQNFVSSTTDSKNSITLPAGSTFYLQVNATDPDGITGVSVELRNSETAGTLPTGPFGVAASDCEAQVAAAPTELTCTVSVTIAPGTTNIAQEGETAYAFRPRVTDAAGNSDLAYSWGYLIVQ